ncbi:hypothetical protein [Flavobacterium succinicans]|nr:hypothetical protein [Flavobacterium succinicans]
MKYLYFFLLLTTSLGFSQISITSGVVTTINNAGQGDLYKTTDTNELFIGLSDGKLALIGANNVWKMGGNTNSLPTSLLGSIGDVKTNLGSNNTTIFELGKRNTLGLVQSFSDYDDPDQYIAHLKGNGVSALQFEATNASFYKPMFYTTATGNFRLKGSAAGSDFFEIGSAGTANNGSLEFIVGDDGDEAILFKKNNYDTNSNIEILRLQGIGLNNTVRVGINTTGVVANSTLQNGGSFSLPINATTSSFVLTDKEYTLILKAGTYTGTAVTLPAATTCKGRIYVIKNNSGVNRSSSSFVSRTGVNASNLGNNTVFVLQSDGTVWQQVN